ncbi:MAG TPA: zf-TFIIB domain-containing protein [Jatrophihabitantaceae bacterium]
MICPKCRGVMAAYERNGVLVEQCSDCRGLFLDRGELEHLINAEASFNRRSAPAADPQFRHQPHSYKRKRRSLFEDLFD